MRLCNMLMSTMNRERKALDDRPQKCILKDYRSVVVRFEQIIILLLKKT